MALDKFKILLAEDNPTEQSLVKEILSNLNCEIDVFERGNQSYQAFTEKDYDLVLMDIRLPEIDGNTAIKYMRAYETLQSKEKTPIVAISASQNLREESFKAGADKFIPKPYNIKKLESMVSYYISKKG